MKDDEERADFLEQYIDVFGAAVVVNNPAARIDLIKGCEQFNSLVLVKKRSLICSECLKGSWHSDRKVYSRGSQPR